VVQAAASLKSGSLSDKMSPAFLATLGMGIIAAGLAGLCFITETTSYYFIGGMMILPGLGFGIFSSPNTNIIMSSVERKHYGLASATMGTMRLTGQSLSMGIAIMAISLMIGNIDLSLAPRPQFISSMRVTFIIFLVLCIFGTYASSVRGKKKQQE
jgi:MFS family permease